MPNDRLLSKGKAHKRYEFGVKVGVVAKLRTPFILAAHSKNPYLYLMLLVCLIFLRRDSLELNRWQYQPSYRMP